MERCVGKDLMKKIILIIPKDDIGFEPLVYAPLGLLYIASTLRDSKIFNVEVYDMREEENGIENVPKSEFYGITAVSSQIEDVKKISEKLKKENNAFVVLGGAAASWQSEELKDYFDTVVIGEAENIVVDVFKNKTKGIVNANLCSPMKADDISFPARDLMERKKIVNSKLWRGYGFGKNNGIMATTVISSRGCPFNCAFCGNLPQKIRFRSVGNIMKEVDYLMHEYGCDHFKLIDDNFVMKKSRLKILMKEFEKRNVKFRCNARSDSINEEICGWLEQGGCEEVGLGVETVDNSLLKMLNKKETVEQHKDAIRLLRKYRIRSKIFLLLGLPGETWGTIEEIKKFIIEVNPDTWIVSLFTPYPGCDMYFNPEKFGFQIVEKDYSKYYQTFPARSNIETENTKREEFEMHHKEIVNFLEKYKIERE